MGRTYVLAQDDRILSFYPFVSTDLSVRIEVQFVVMIRPLMLILRKGQIHLTREVCRWCRLF